MDHEKVVRSKDAVISDEALAALLDRTLQNSKKEDVMDTEVQSVKRTAVEHSDIFKIIAERDSRGSETLADGDGGNVSTIDVLSTAGNVHVLKNGHEVVDTSSGCSSSSTTPEPASSLSSGSSSVFVAPVSIDNVQDVSCSGAGETA